MPTPTAAPESLDARLDRIEELLQELIEKLNNIDLPGRDYSIERWED